MPFPDKKRGSDSDEDLVDLTKKSKFAKSKESKIKPVKKKDKDKNAATSIPLGKDKDRDVKSKETKDNSGESLKGAKGSKRRGSHKEDKEKDKLRRANIKAEEREKEKEREREWEKEKERERRAKHRTEPQRPPQRPPKAADKPTTSRRTAQSKQNQLHSALHAIQTAKPFVDATPEQERKMYNLIRMQEASGFFKLTESFCKQIGLAYSTLKMDAISHSFNPNAWATTLFMVYVDYKLAALKATYIKEYDRAKLWVYKNYAVSQKKLESAAIARIVPGKATTDINVSKK